MTTNASSVQPRPSSPPASTALRRRGRGDLRQLLRQLGLYYRERRAFSAPGALATPAMEDLMSSLSTQAIVLHGCAGGGHEGGVRIGAVVVGGSRGGLEAAHPEVADLQREPVVDQQQVW